MPDAVHDFVVGKIFVAARDHRDLVTGGAVGAGQQQMHLLDRAAEHRRNRIKRTDDNGDAHAPDYSDDVVTATVIPAPWVCSPAGADREAQARSMFRRKAAAMRSTSRANHPECNL